MDPAHDEQSLWTRYRRDGDAVARSTLFDRYVPWSRSVARDVYRRVRLTQLDWADYAQNASLGLIEAMGRFDVARGIDFMAYAKPRVRGAVFNGLRTFLEDGHPQGYSSRYRARAESLQGEEGDDLLEQLVGTVTGLGLGFLLESHATDSVFLASGDASALAEHSQLGSALQDALEALGSKERQVLTLHYYQHLPFVEIAAILDLTKGRISQLHRAGLERMRRALRDGHTPSAA
jgi:RNA polymerase sigma factor for flagellar operon FliA